MQYFQLESEPDPEKTPLVRHTAGNTPIVLTDERPRRTWQTCILGCAIFTSIFLCSLGLWHYQFNPDRSLQARHTLQVGAGELTEGDLQVKVKQGFLQGKRMQSRAGRNYSAYLGIPYAQPPVAELRFQPPVKADRWEGVRDSTYFRDTCMEKFRGDKNAKLEDQPDVTDGSEDCLYLNVYTHSKTRRDRYPVMVYIHGGAGGAFGSGQKYGADYFMDQDVVLVTLEFRLGVLGNLNTNTKLASGNQGMKDQLLGLQWVQDNIKKFGGDRNTVTIFGNSFGGIQVIAHMLSPLGQGLYHRAIAQSGTLLYPGFFTENPLHDASRLGNLLSCPNTTTATGPQNSTTTQQNLALTQCLLNVTAQALVLQSLKLKNDFNYIFTISNDLAAESPFLPNGPLESLESGRIKGIPFITGIVDAEGLKDSLEVMTNPEKLAGYESNWTQLLVPTIYLEHTVQNVSRLTEMSLKIRDFYLGQPPSQNRTVLNSTNFMNFTNMFTDRLYLHPEATVLNNLRSNYETRGTTKNRKNRNNAFLYHFSHRITHSRTDALQEKYDGHAQYYGICHADELQFFFPFDAFPYIPIDHAYFNFSRQVVKLWVNFAKTGIPSGFDNPMVTWDPVNEQNPYRFMELNESPAMGEEKLAGRIKFWSQFNTSELYM